jgi:hypothetical protein
MSSSSSVRVRMATQKEAAEPARYAGAANALLNARLAVRVPLSISGTRDLRALVKER